MVVQKYAKDSQLAVSTGICSHTVFRDGLRNLFSFSLKKPLKVPPLQLSQRKIARTKIEELWHRKLLRPKFLAPLSKGLSRLKHAKSKQNAVEIWRHI